MHAHRGLAAIVVAALAMGVSLQACADGKAGRGANMTATPAKSNGSGVGVQFRIDGEAQAGVATPVVLSFDGITDPAGATVSFATDGGLALVGTAGPHALAAGQATTITVQVIPRADSIGYLNVFTTQRGATSATAIPLQVGKAPSALPANSGLKQTPGGDKIISTPVK